MNIQCITCLIGIFLSSPLLAINSMYCPENHAYINQGMSQAQVIAACGQPISKQETDQPLAQKIPLKQLIYNNKGTDTAFYGIWNIPTGSGGTQLVIDIINNKVKGVKVEAGGSNSLTVCDGMKIQIGDPISKVFNYCGNPSITNTTFINEPIPTNNKPQIWIFKPGPYQPSFSLTFIDGKLQSINQ